MSLELHAFIHKSRVPAPRAWQAAIEPLGFDLKIDGDFTPFESSGFLPCKLNGELSGFEIYYDLAADLIDAYPELQGKIGDRDVAISFRWGSRAHEGACVCIAAAALAEAFDAIVYDPQCSEFVPALSTEESPRDGWSGNSLIATARSFLSDPNLFPREPETPQPPPRPSLWQRFIRRLKGGH